MSILDLWLDRQPSEDSQDSQVAPSANLTAAPAREREEEEEESLTVRACLSNPANTAKPRRWIDMADIVTLVEDLADEGMRPGRISRLLGLTTAEVVTILRRTGR
jgi:hypothetical protein